MEPHPDLDPDALDPLVSAVVEVQERPDAGPAGEDPLDVVSQAASVIGGVDLGVDAASSAGPSAGQASVSRLKGWFEKAGFEVHAPIGNTFSIAGRRSFFERFFARSLVVDEERFFAPVTTDDGGDQLPIEALPDEVRTMVRSISLPSPPELPEGLQP